MSTRNIIAHRGASKLAPENTMIAFQKSYLQGARSIETDVRLTRDNIPVLIHDATINRTTNRRGYVSEFTYRQLLELDIGAWFSKAFIGERIVSLDSFLQWAQQKSLYLHLELKHSKQNPRQLEEIVYDLLKDKGLLNRTTISTFHTTSIARMKTLDDTIEIAFLTSKRKKNLAKFAREIGASALHIEYRLLKRKIIKQCQEQHIHLRVYTVNKPAHMQKCFQYGCDIITDYPGVGLQQYNQFMMKKTLS